jgi:hypothetical protein
VLIDGDVLAVEDGDTFLLGTAGDEIKVRLLGVNAPERDECMSEQATAGLSSYLDRGELEVEGHGTDQFGRTLGYVWAGESFVNLALVEDGLVIANTPGAGEIWGPNLLAAERSAYREGIGLWDPVGCDADLEANVELSIDISGHDPPGPDEEVIALEHVIVANDGDDPVDLSGWILRDESSSHRFRFPDGSVVDAGDVLVVTSDHPAWEPGGSPVWNNDGDMALLLTPDGAVATRERYRP